MRSAKIGATLGPACDDEITLGRMVVSGIDVARLNFSHGEAVDHRRRARRLRKAARAAGRNVALLADLQGPRFRVGRLVDGPLELADGEGIELVAGRAQSRSGTIPITYSALARSVRRGDRVLIDDGNIELRVERVRGDVVACEVARGGTVRDNKGVNLPAGRLSASALTVKDRRDLRLAVELGADWLAVSFVRRAEDVRLARRLLARAGSDLPVMAKIERPEAIEQLQAILVEADGLLVARGDLGVELPPQQVPILQKQMIEAANAAGKPAMTATQMLESMRHSRQPTRAEASDVANAVLDGSDCLLLTAETAAGDYPVEAVQMMASIIEQAESSGRVPRVGPPVGELPVPMSTCLAGCRAAYEIGARYLTVFTQSGFSARQVARFRPRTPIIAYTPKPEVTRRLAVLWGVGARTVRVSKNAEELVSALDRALVEEGRVEPGERIVILAGWPIGVSGTTNLVHLHQVGSGRGPSIRSQRVRARGGRAKGR